MIGIGIDIGSVATKGVIIDGALQRRAIIAKNKKIKYTG